MWIFGGGAAKKAEEPKNAIVKLQESLTLLEKRQAHLQKQADEQEAHAKKNMHNKRGKRPSYITNSSRFECAQEEEGV